MGNLLLTDSLCWWEGFPNHRCKDITMAKLRVGAITHQSLSTKLMQLGKQRRLVLNPLHVANDSLKCCAIPTWMEGVGPAANWPTMGKVPWTNVDVIGW